MESALERKISNSSRGSRDKRSREGCIICRLRKKNCSGPLSATEHNSCPECNSLNVICLGFPGQRPKGMQKNKAKVKELKEKIKDWNSKRSNRNPGVLPLDLSEYSFLVSHPSDASYPPPSTTPAQADSSFSHLHTSVSQDHIQVVSHVSTVPSNAESSLGATSLHRSLSETPRVPRPSLRLDPVNCHPPSARTAPYPQQGVAHQSDGNTLLTPHLGAHRHQRSRSLSSMPKERTIDRYPNVLQPHQTHHRGAGSVDAGTSRQQTLHPGSFGTSLSADSSLYSPIPQLLVSPAETDDDPTSQFHDWRSHSSGANSPFSSPSALGSPRSDLSDFDDPGPQFNNQYPGIPDQPSISPPYGQQTLNHSVVNWTETEALRISDDSSLLGLGVGQLPFSAPHLPADVGSLNPPNPSPNVNGAQQAHFISAPPSPFDQVGNGMGLDFGALNLGVDPGNGRNEESYRVPDTSSDPILLQLGTSSNLAGVNHHDTYPDLASFPEREFGPAEQAMVSAFLNLLPDSSDEFRAYNP